MNGVTQSGSLPHFPAILRIGRAAAALVLSFACASCGYLAARELSGTEVPAPSDFSYLDPKTPCYLELERGQEALRVNCFHIDGTLAIHSSRWAKLPRFSGESWTVTIRRQPDVRVEIDGNIYAVRAEAIEDENVRRQILDERGYWVAWDGIKVFRFFSGNEK